MERAWKAMEHAQHFSRSIFMPHNISPDRAAVESAWPYPRLPKYLMSRTFWRRTRQFGSLDEALQERNPGNQMAKPPHPDCDPLHPGYTF